MPTDPAATVSSNRDGSLGVLRNISLGGFLLESASALDVGDHVTELVLAADGQLLPLPEASVVREETLSGDVDLLGFRFDNEIDELFRELSALVRPSSYVSEDLLRKPDGSDSGTWSLKDWLAFRRTENRDLFSKCAHASKRMEEMIRSGDYQARYRPTLTRGLDHRTVIFNPFTDREEEFICFDSNGYLGLQTHPRVVEATKRALEDFGYGTPSVPLLSGTSRHLRELEEAISDFHGREAAIIFTSGYVANVATITALANSTDRVFVDQFAHASIHDAAGWAMGTAPRVFRHNSVEHLRGLLSSWREAETGGGLVVTDGVFSMQGTVADLPGISAVCRENGAYLMIDEAHGTGVVGPTGRGTEELLDSNGAADILMGTLSKAPGTVGGYVCGSQELITFLRFFSNPAVFSCSLPAATCAGATEAFRIMADDPEPRQRLWANVDYMVQSLRAAGFAMNDPLSPILPISVNGSEKLKRATHELVLRGIRCGPVSFPAVPHGQEILRVTLNARHTQTDMDRCVEALSALRGQGLVESGPGADEAGQAASAAE
ncbi:MAG: aminotransferase class I/II-fold pyridoxal phosphate-dependent enzyme [Myxococcota bacterium]